jgi:hypothetical protein
LCATARRQLECRSSVSRLGPAELGRCMSSGFVARPG